MKHLILIAIFLISITSCRNDKNSSTSYLGKWKLESLERTKGTSSIENVLLLTAINTANTTVNISDGQMQFYQNDTLIEKHKIKISGTKIAFLKEGKTTSEGVIAQSGDKMTITMEDYVYTLTKN